MSASIQANDWQCVGVAQAGAVAGVGAGVYFFEFRSRNADFRGAFNLFGAGIGLGGSLGGATAPSPSDVIHNRNPDLFTSLRADRPFSANNLHLSYANYRSIGASAAVGYSIVRISAASLWNNWFTGQDVSGWGIGGISAGAVALGGLWVKLSEGKYYV
jgi:hypothetical protein